MKSISFVLIGGLILTGCKGSSDAEVGADDTPVRRVIEFKGAVDDRFVGRWKGVTQEGTYDFQKTGDFKFNGVLQSQGGPMKIEYGGKWLVDADRLVVLDDKNETYDFTFKLDGTTLSLKTNGQRKLENKYTRLK